MRSSAAGTGPARQIKRIDGVGFALSDHNGESICTLFVSGYTDDGLAPLSKDGGGQEIGRILWEPGRID